MSVLYVLGDADQIRRKVEGLLLADDLRGLKMFSAAITENINRIAGLARDMMGAEIIFCGGDDILFLVQRDRFREVEVKDWMQSFLRQTGNNISFGVGSTAEEAFLNLARAKATGFGLFISVDRIVSEAANTSLKRTPDGAA